MMKVIVDTNHIHSSFNDVKKVIVGECELRICCGVWVYIYSIPEVINLEVEEEIKNG